MVQIVDNQLYVYIFKMMFWHVKQIKFPNLFVFFIINTYFWGILKSSFCVYLFGLGPFTAR